MRVLIDATAVPAHRGGVGRYVDALVLALHRLGTDVVVVAQQRDMQVYADMGVDVVAAPAFTGSVPGRMVWEQVGLPGVARKAGADVLHSPHYTFPLFTSVQRVVTIHDLTFFTDPQVHRPVKRYFFRAWMRLARRARLRIVAVSRATAGEFERIVGAAKHPVTVTGLGFDPERFHVPSDAEVAEARSHLGLTAGWIAFLATLEPRKNAPTLIDAYAELAAQRADLPPLVLAGGQGWDHEVDPAIARAVAAGADVRKVGYLPLDMLAGFLGGSEVFAYPSRGEGFGLPVLEAMACGAAVMTTRELALPEVGGDAVAYCGTDRADIGRVLAGLLDDPAERARLSALALERAREFNWDEVAARHVTAYNEAR